MTPKEKAKELIDKFHLKVLDREGTSAMNGFEAKQCALIAVNEILEAQPSRRYWDTYYDESPSALIYWQEVKQEIEKL